VTRKMPRVSKLRMKSVVAGFENGMLWDCLFGPAAQTRHDRIHQNITTRKSISHGQSGAKFIRSMIALDSDKLQDTLAMVTFY
jgi:hypothetical protein